MKTALALSAFALTLVAPAAYMTTRADPATDHHTAAGFWAEVDDKGHTGGWFYFSRVKGSWEGRIVRMFKTKPDDPDITTCSKCKGDQKDAPMLGLTLIKGMKRDGLKYESGTILDPRDGSVYNAEMSVSEDGEKLSVRGYLGISLFGETQVWTRLPDDSIAPCDIPPASYSPNATPSPGPLPAKGCVTAPPQGEANDASAPSPKQQAVKDKDPSAPAPKKHAKDHPKPTTAPDAASPSPD